MASGVIATDEWFMDDSNLSNMSMKSEDFNQGLPLAELDLSFDSQLDSSRQEQLSFSHGIPLLIKKMGVSAKNENQENIFAISPSQSHSRKRKLEDEIIDETSQPNKKSKTETGSIGFTDMIMLSNKKKTDTADPFLLNLNRSPIRPLNLEPSKNNKTNFIPFQTMTEKNEKNNSPFMNNSCSPFNNNNNKDDNNSFASLLSTNRRTTGPSLFNITTEDNESDKADGLISTKLKQLPKKSWAEVCSDRKLYFDGQFKIEQVTKSPSDAGSAAPSFSSFTSGETDVEVKEEETDVVDSNIVIDTLETHNIGDLNLMSDDEEKKKDLPKSLSKEQRLERRKHQINLGKESVGYKNYIRLIPKHKRRNVDPETPDGKAMHTLSKRRFDGLVRTWRRKLHDFDNFTEADLDSRYVPTKKKKKPTKPKEMKENLK